MKFPDTIAGAKLLAGLNEPPEIGPENKIIPVTTNPIIRPAIYENSFLDVTPKIVSIKKKVRTNSKMNDCTNQPEGIVVPNVKFLENVNFSKPLAKIAPRI